MATDLPENFHIFFFKFKISIHKNISVTPLPRLQRGPTGHCGKNTIPYGAIEGNQANSRQKDGVCQLLFRGCFPGFDIVRRSGLWWTYHV